MTFPSELKYTKEHEWVLVEGNTAIVGITDHAQDQLGDIVYVEVETVGEVVEANEIFGTIEAVKTTSDLFMPITGEILEVNARLNDEPELVNSDPYGDGWIMKMKIHNLADVDKLLDSVAYEAEL